MKSIKQAALVTGGAIRLGKAIAIDLAKYGFDIAIHYNSSTTEAMKTSEEIKNYGVDCDVFQFDLIQQKGFDTLIQKVLDKFPHLNLLINNASIYEQKNILATEESTFEQQIAVNLKAPFFLSKYYAQFCGKGNIINIIDNKVAFNQYAYAAYLLSKKSLAEFTKMAALEFAPNIRVNGISPGVILPAFTRSQEYLEWRKQAIPLKMKGETSNITQGIISILENDFITGQILTIDGGESISNIGKHSGDYDQTKI
jgi:NAD(P)-dependent dehydrogenase (short-subunit alcohol dehydrogenase family)